MNKNIPTPRNDDVISAECTYNMPSKLRIIHNLSDYNNVAGVWALYGKNKSTERWRCLQVCQTSNIRKEILYDKKAMKMEKDKLTQRKYVSYFGTSFDFKTAPTPRQALYIHIRENYKYLAYVLVIEEKDKIKREKIEKSFAIKHRAVYWRNQGGQRKILPQT